MFSGNLVNVIIPRPGPNGEPVPGVGKVICRDDAVSVLFKLSDHELLTIVASL